ncbi:RNase adapter RapZ [Thermodesulfitimonas autotrophica]|uniref:RNase adapter RapZ n=1 Tax=Thermodesulfitimonas autotrophica TaxID=1894989 RepID=UPI002FE144D5
MALPRLVILTGLSGAGKTQALRCLEDHLGFFCVDNLPPSLIPKFADLCARAAAPIQRLALVVDIRGGELFKDVFEVLAELDREAIPYEIVFLEASDEALVRRFKESRRPHPLGGELLEAIRKERACLEELRGRAHKVIDTTNLTPHQLKEQLITLFGDEESLRRFRITLLSFGYKYGIPLDADLVIDVRFLPNPHYIARLRPLTGEDLEVKDYVLSSPITAEFLAKFTSLIEFLIPLYMNEGKSMLTIAVGCTGGRHRSVAIANRLAELLAAKDYQATVRHRDMQRDA